MSGWKSEADLAVHEPGPQQPFRRREEILEPALRTHVRTLPWVRVRADAHYTRFNSSFGSGYLRVDFAVAQFERQFQARSAGGRADITARNTATNSNANFVTSEVEMNIGFHYFLQGGYTVRPGSDPELRSVAVHFRLPVRLASEGKRRNDLATQSHVGS